MATGQPTVDDSLSAMQARAATSAGWTISAGVVSRALGLGASLAITYFLEPEIVGEVGAAAVLVLTTSQLSTIGIGNYLIVKREEGARTVFHATLLHVVLGVAALAALSALAAPLCGFLHAPHAARYVPWLALSVLLDRVGFVPERILIRALSFRRVAMVRAGAETSYAVCAIAFAILGLGGMAIVLANVVRSAVRAALVTSSVRVGDWLRPRRLSLAIYRRMLGFGLPLWLGSLAEFASCNWDNLIISRLYGPAVMGTYQLAYNLADVPAGQVGEQVAEVLLPTFSRLGPEDRRRSLVSSFGVLAFVMFPIAIGIAAVASTLVHVVMRPSWQSAAPMLAALCVLSMLRPLSWLVGSYLLANERPGVHMSVSLLKLAVLVAALLTMGRLGTLWACAAVGVAFLVSLLAALRAIAVADGIPMRVLLGRGVPPLLACVPLVLAVLVARRATMPGALGLLLEIAAGVVGFVGGAFTLAPRHTHELLALVRAARERRAAR